MVRLSVLLGSILLVVCPQSFAGEYFENLRNDQRIPEKCSKTRLSDFGVAKLDYFTVSIKGAYKRGFTYEYPISRSSVRKIWKSVNPSNVNPDPSLMGHVIKKPGGIISEGDRSYDIDHKLIVDNMQTMGFDMKSEGQVLEVLAILAMEKELPEEYFVYGSVEYHQNNSRRTIGELDLVVGLKENCKILAVGEAKVGIKSLSHAHRQLRRFKNFISQATQMFLPVRVNALNISN